MKALLIFALLPMAVQAQLTIYVLNGTTETLVGSSYNFGQVALNATADVRFRVYNTGATVVSANVTLSGAGFTFQAPPLPFPIPGYSTAPQALNIGAHFKPSSGAGYSANLQVGSLSVILLGSGVTAASLTSVSACSTNAPYNFGNVKAGGSESCTFGLQNLNSQAITVANIAVNGLGFNGPFGVTAPLILQTGQSATFSVTFTPPGALAYTGTLSIGTQTYSLTGQGLPPPLPTPSLQFDSAAAGSAQQRVLTMTIPGGSPISASGYVNLAFAPSTNVVKDDSGIAFLVNGSRAIPFTVSAGSTQALLNGQASAVFQTGTTEGTITFTVTSAAGLAGDPTVTLAIRGAAMILDSIHASKARLGFLDISIAGADNTYSAGAMSFSFFDTNGNAIGAAMSADFTGSFKTFYAGQSAGSTFKVIVSFPVTGNSAPIGSVAVTLTNAAGVANTGKLSFQ